MALIVLTEAERRAFSNNWLLFLIWGVFLIVLGVFAISASVFTTFVTIIVIGSLLLLAGIIMIIDAFNFWWEKWGGFFLHFVMGLLYAVAGFIFLVSPIWAAMALTLLLGALYTIVGLFRIIYALSFRMPQWGWTLFSGLVAFLLGILIMDHWPVAAIFIIGLFVGIDLIVAGWTYLMIAINSRRIVRRTPARRRA